MRNFSVWDCCPVGVGVGGCSGGGVMMMSRRNAETILFCSVHPALPPPPTSQKLSLPVENFLETTSFEDSRTYYVICNSLWTLFHHFSELLSSPTATSDASSHKKPSDSSFQLPCKLPSNATHSHGSGTSRPLHPWDPSTPPKSSSARAPLSSSIAPHGLPPSWNPQEQGPELTRAVEQGAESRPLVPRTAVHLSCKWRSHNQLE